MLEDGVAAGHMKHVTKAEYQVIEIDR